MFIYIFKESLGDDIQMNEDGYMEDYYNYYAEDQPLSDEDEIDIIAEI